MPEQDIIEDILAFFENVFVPKSVDGGRYKCAAYREEWLKNIDLNENSADEAKSYRTTKKLQEFLSAKYGARIKIEAKVAENMTLRFKGIDVQNEEAVETEKLQAFDILDVQNGVAIEISLADAFAEFFKDVLKAILDSRVKKLYICMRNHHYRGAKNSGYVKVATSPMVRQYIHLARLYKLDIVLLDLCPSCNE
ncbi:hypothetical protein [Sulfuricystis multivorans]|uniref:hypothetical protein n=1 Tax=Sulfuricystis multivorans TaxID=2211108 RepID=UPI000F82A541|nr:hypothetical protein [Sulfuricystis multivorans]